MLNLKSLEKIIQSNFFTDRLYLKKQLYKLKMDKGTNARDHISKFNMRITQLLGVEIKIDEEDQMLILLTSLSKSYETLMTILSVER